MVRTISLIIFCCIVDIFCFFSSFRLFLLYLAFFVACNIPHCWAKLFPPPFMPTPSIHLPIENFLIADAPARPCSWPECRTQVARASATGRTRRAAATAAPSRRAASTWGCGTECASRTAAATSRSASSEPMRRTSGDVH